MTPVPAYYAKALFDASEKLGCTRAVAGELPEVTALAGGCGAYLRNPIFGDAEKTELLTELLSGRVSALTLEFALLLVKRRHLKHLPSIADNFLRLNNNRLGYTDVKIKVPYELPPETLEVMRKKLTAMGLIPELNADKARITVEIDRDVIGGFVAYGEGTQIDASLRTALAKLRRRGGYI